MDLLLNVRRDDHGATVDVAGEIDHHSSTQLLDCALCAIREHGPRLAVDLADVTFMDCGGVDVLLAVRRRSHLLGGYLSVVSASAPVRRLLAILDMDAVLTAPESSEVDTTRDEEFPLWHCFLPAQAGVPSPPARSRFVRSRTSTTGWASC